MAEVGKGGAISFSSTQGGSYTKFAQVKDIPLPEISKGKVEVTHQESANNFTEHVQIGWADAGDVPFEMNFSKAEYAAYFAQITGGSGDVWFKITSRSGNVWGFPGFISKLSGTIPLKDKVMVNCTISITGVVTFTAAA